MTHLSLAVDIADNVLEADREQRPLDASSLAQQLAQSHPEAGLAPDEVHEAVREEAAAAGILA